MASPHRSAAPPSPVLLPDTPAPGPKIRNRKVAVHSTHAHADSPPQIPQYSAPSPPLPMFADDSSCSTYPARATPAALQPTGLQLDSRFFRPTSFGTIARPVPAASAPSPLPPSTSPARSSVFQ